MDILRSRTVPREGLALMKTTGAVGYVRAQDEFSAPGITTHRSRMETGSYFEKEYAA